MALAESTQRSMNRAAISSAAAARRAALGTLVGAAMLPLQWQHLGATKLGHLRLFHIGIVAMILIGRPTLAGIRRTMFRAKPMMYGVLTLTFVATATAWYQGAKAANPVQDFIYAMLGLLGGVVVATGLSEPAGRRLLAWACPVTLVTFLYFFGHAMQAAGVHPITAYRQVLYGGQSDAVLLHQVFAVAFQSAGTTADEETLSQARHDIFCALLLSGFLSAIALPSERRPNRRVLIIGSIVAVVVLVAVSFSRATLIALLIPVLVGAYGVVTRARVSPLVLVGAFWSLATVPFLIGPVQAFIVNRFLNDTASYQARSSAWSAFTASSIGSRLIAGGPELATSTHTILGDAILRGDLLAGIGAAFIVVASIRLFRISAGRYLGAPSAARLAVVGLLSIFIVRSWTSGGGYLHLTSWLAVWTAAAILACPDYEV